MSMIRYLKRSDLIILDAPVEGVIGGSLYKQESLVGVVVDDAKYGESFSLLLEGAFGDVPKKPGEAWKIGDMLYYETSSGSLTKFISCNTWAGYAYKPADIDDTTGAILLKM